MADSAIVRIYDLAVVGAGSGGLTAARFAARLGARVALVERHRIGGDCTWTGCVPSKSLLKVAKVAHDVQTAGTYGILVAPPVIDMAAVRAYVERAITDIYQHETPEALRGQGIDVLLGHARFANAHTLTVEGEGGAQQLVRARSFLLCTGARPRAPDIPGLAEVPYRTYEDIFENERLPGQMVVIGAGPIGMELAQAYQRLGAQVTVVGERVLAREDPEAAAIVRGVLEREGVRFVAARPRAVRWDGESILIEVPGAQLRCDLLLIAVGRAPVTDGLGLDRAGVGHSAAGVPVDAFLRTSVRHIYAAGDVIGGPQFTHLAGWQAFQATRNALLPGKARGDALLIPRVTYTDPEVAHVGLTEAEATQGGGKVIVTRRPLAHVDRAVCENDRDGIIKLVQRAGGKLVGATIVSGRAGDALAELVLGMQRGLTPQALAGAIHAYPTYSTGVQQALVEAATGEMLGGRVGRLVRWLVRR